jgi:Family of unknown function (DUF5772)
MSNRQLTLAEKWKRLNKLMATRHTNWFSIQWNTLIVAIKSWWYDVRLVGSVASRIGEISTVEYTFKGNVYRVLVKTVHVGPPREHLANIVSIETAYTHIDVTDIVKPYLGPTEDSHGITITPRMIGLPPLRLMLASGDTIIIDSDSPIRAA